MGPVHSNVGDFVAPALIIVFVVAGRMTIPVVVCVIISEYVRALFVSGVIRIPNCPSFFACAYSPDLKVLDDIENDAIVTENVPGNLAGFRGQRRNL